MGRARENILYTPAGKAGFLLGYCDFGLLVFQYEWHEQALARSTIIGRKPGKTIATIYEFLDLDLHLEILKARGRTVLILTCAT